MFLSLCSTFILNDAGGGGAMGVAYFPLSFNGSTVFETNRGRTVVVCEPVLHCLNKGKDSNSVYVV